MLDKWEKLSEKKFKGAYKTFLTKKYKSPNGSVHNFDIWYVPRGVVNIFALTKSNEVVVAKQFRQGPEKILFEMPAGICEKGETIEEAARRELREESGYEAGKLTLLLKDSTFSFPYAQGSLNFFLAEDCKLKYELDLDDSEFIEVQTMSIKDFLDKGVRKGLVSHAEGAWFAIDYLIKKGKLKYSDVF